MTALVGHSLYFLSKHFFFFDKTPLMTVVDDITLRKSRISWCAGKKVKMHHNGLDCKEELNAAKQSETVLDPFCLLLYPKYRRRAQQGAADVKSRQFPFLSLLQLLKTASAA